MHALFPKALSHWPTHDSQKLKTQIELIQENDMKEMKTMVDLGTQFYVQAHM